MSTASSPKAFQSAVFILHIGGKTIPEPMRPRADARRHLAKILRCSSAGAVRRDPLEIHSSIGRVRMNKPLGADGKAHPCASFLRRHPYPCAHINSTPGLVSFEKIHRRARSGRRRAERWHHSIQQCQMRLKRAQSSYRVLLHVARASFHRIY